MSSIYLKKDFRVLRTGIALWLANNNNNSERADNDNNNVPKTHTNYPVTN